MNGSERFKLLKRFRGGHRFFRDYETGMLALADQSGKYPDQTDDGVLYIDFGRFASAYQRRSFPWTNFNVPVMKEEEFEDESIRRSLTMSSSEEEFGWLEEQGLRLERKPHDGLGDDDL